MIFWLSGNQIPLSPLQAEAHVSGAQWKAYARSPPKISIMHLNCAEISIVNIDCKRLRSQLFRNKSESVHCAKCAWPKSAFHLGRRNPLGNTILFICPVRHSTGKQDKMTWINKSMMVNEEVLQVQYFLSVGWSIDQQWLRSCLCPTRNRESFTLGFGRFWQYQVYYHY